MFRNTCSWQRQAAIGLWRTWLGRTENGVLTRIEGFSYYGSDTHMKRLGLIEAIHFDDVVRDLEQ